MGLAPPAFYYRERFMQNHFQSEAPLIPEILALHGKWQANKQAIICNGNHVNWRSFSENINRFANGLISQGLSKGSRVGVVMSNSIATVESLAGIMAAGCVSVPINLSVTNDALIAMLNDAEIQALIATSDQQERLSPHLSRLSNHQQLVFISTGPDHRPWQNYQSFIEAQPSSSPAVTLDNDNLLNIIYSSGTTGQPKGIVHTHKGRRDWAYDLSIALRYHCSARTLITLGLYSNISWVAMLSTLLAGGTLVLHSQFNAIAFLETVETEKITHTAMVPIQYQRILEAAKDNTYNTSSLSAMMSCGSPLHANIKREVFSFFNCGVIELYGLTEGIITTLEPEEAEGRWSSVGKPLIGTDICILKDDNTLASSGESGEIVSRGRITMPGYLNRKDATLDASWTDEKGNIWLRSGDIGLLDDDGYLYIVDRKKDMIVSGGQNIYPQDIEAQLVQHPNISEAAVIGATSKKWDETPIGLVVKSGDANICEQDLKLWCNQRVGKQQRLTDIIFIDQLPRNPNGKILKRELRETFSDKVYD